MSSRLGMAKVYFKKEDFGKMLKLEDVYNLVISNVEHCNDGSVEITIVTPMDNATNNRVKIELSNHRMHYKEYYTFEDDSYGDKNVLEDEHFPNDYITIKNSSGEKVGRIRKSDIKFYKSLL